MRQESIQTYDRKTGNVYNKQVNVSSNSRGLNQLMEMEVDELEMVVVSESHMESNLADQSNVLLIQEGEDITMRHSNNTSLDLTKIT